MLGPWFVMRYLVFFLVLQSFNFLQIIQSLINTPLYYTDLDISLSCSGFHFLPWNFTKSFLWTTNILL